MVALVGCYLVGELVWHASNHSDAFQPESTSRTACLNIDPVVMFIEYKFYEIKTKISNVCN